MPDQLPRTERRYGRDLEDRVAMLEVDADSAERRAERIEQALEANTAATRWNTRTQIGLLVTVVGVALSLLIGRLV